MKLNKLKTPIMKTIKPNYTLLFCLLFSAGIFAQTKERGAELVFKRLTIIFGTTFMVIPIIIALLSK